jgi:hypothetical protein
MWTLISERNYQYWLPGTALPPSNLHQCTPPSIMHLSIYPSIHPFIYPSIHSSIHQFIIYHSPIHLPIHSSIHPLIHSFIHPSSTHLPIHPSAHSTLIHSSIHPSIQTFTHLSSFHSFICPSNHPPIHASEGRVVACVPYLCPGLGNHLRSGDIALWQSTCLACTRPWVWSLALQKKKNHKLPFAFGD